MERSRHRTRNLPTEALVAELVVRLVDAMETADIDVLDTPRARRVFHELEQRQIVSERHSPSCMCAECFADRVPPDGESDPF